MLRTILLTSLIALPAAAQSTMDHGTMIAGMGMTPVVEPGQGAFAAIEEIVLTLAADPNTDWSTVDIAGLREHLRDMDLVFIHAEVEVEGVENGQRYIISGEGRVLQAIRNMAIAHAGVMDGVDGWHYSTETPAGLSASAIPNSVAMIITVPPQDLPKLKALGFFGVMADGMHHQDHHWMMATGADPHQ